MPQEECENSQTKTGASKRRRRPRAAVACDSCRTRKVKCDGGFPCSSCTQHSFECSYKDRPIHVIVSRGEEEQPQNSVHQTFQPRLAPLPEGSVRTELQTTSPASLDDVSAPESLGPIPEHIQASANEHAAPMEDNSTGIGDVNRHTGGSEFYGPSGTFYFLSKLRSHAKSKHQLAIRNPVSDKANSDNSVVTLLHSSDYPAINTEDRGIRRPATGPSIGTDRQSSSMHTVHGPTKPPGSSPAEFEVEIQRECVRLYFENLHCVHPVLNHASFLTQCEKDVWLEGEDSAAPSNNHCKRRFLALFNVVLAIGAITAGETSLLSWDRTVNFLDHEEKKDAFSSAPPYTPIRVARLYFERARLLVGDIFESSSFETGQTLFLMAVFCQNALKPHSCYMYSGMALRTALAIGVPMKSQSKSSHESRFWWTLYSFEIEMSSSSGRLSFLQAPDHYRIPLPAISNLGDPLLPFVHCMVDLAKILADVAANANWLDDDSSLTDKSSRSINLEKRLYNWKSCLPQQLNFESASLNENELITKQKVVLKLRFLNVKVLIHRPFLLSSINERDSILVQHVSSCVEAARETIRFVYDTYLYRPYFRTWWYNCTYVLDASMVLLYVILANVCPCPVEAVIGDVDKSLEIFASMKMLSVARKCTEITKEVLNAAKKLHLDAHLRTNGLAGLEPVAGSREVDQLGIHPGVGLDFSRDRLGGIVGGNDLTYEELYTSLVDTNLVFDFFNFEDWNDWSADGYDLYEGQAPGQ